MNTLVKKKPLSLDAVEALEHLFIGPTWQKNDDGSWHLPEHTLGWQIAEWCADYLLNEEGDPWEFTLEQLRFILWWYAIDERGKFIYRRGVLQRAKGWGKDPLLAVICLVEFVGPCRLAYWDNGNPVAEPVKAPFVQVTAVDQSQTDNTMDMLAVLASDKLKATYKIKPGVEIWRADGGKRKLIASTSNYRSAEGRRTTFTVLNEALAVDTPIPTPSGWTTMGELRDGDVIYGASGQRITVTKAHEIQYDRDCFRVTFDDGSSIVASDGHWWKVYLNTNRKSSLHQMTTREMFDAGRSFYLPDSFDSLETVVDDNLLVHPYLLGLWLGDGAARSSVIATSAEDRDELIALVEACGESVASRDENHFRISEGGPRVSKHESFQGRLRRLGVLRNKHIPDEYLRASNGARLALLQGLMDSDGSVRRDGNCRFTNTNEALLSQARELLISLGYHVRQPAFQGREHIAERSHWKPLGAISFQAVKSVNPFRLSRKRNEVTGEKSVTRSRRRRIVDIEQVDSVPVRCISVSAEDKLFLAGEGMHATRNTHHWIAGNNGHKMYATIDGNSTKMAKKGSRYLAITNAPLPGEDSIAERMRLAYEAIVDGRAPDIGFLYDSVEAHPDTPLYPEALRHVLPIIFGDAHWLDVEATISSILDLTFEPARSRRMYLNQLVADDDKLVPPQLWKSLGDEDLELMPGDEIVLGFDGGKTDDSTALVAIRVRDGAAFLLCLEERPAGPLGEGWHVNTIRVDNAVHDAFRLYKVKVFYADVAEWESHIDDWADDYREQLVIKASDKHAVAWDMRQSLQRVTRAHERLLRAIFDGKIKHDGNIDLRRHAMNAVRRTNKYGVSFGKESRESPNKVDAYAALVLAYEAYHDLRTRPMKKQRERTGRVVFY